MKKMIKVPQEVVTAAFNVIFVAHDTACNVIAGQRDGDCIEDKEIRDEGKIFLDWYSSIDHAKQLKP